MWVGECVGVRHEWVVVVVNGMVSQPLRKIRMHCLEHTNIAYTKEHWMSLCPHDSRNHKKEAREDAFMYPQGVYELHATQSRGLLHRTTS